MQPWEASERYTYLAVSAILAGGVAGYFWPARADSFMPMDNPVSVNGVETVCTGIGDEAEHDPRWLSYPIRVEFSNGGAQYLSGAHVELSEGGKTLTAVDCAGPWVLFKVAPGNYKIAASLLYDQGGGERSAMVSPPSSGQKRVVLQFKLQPNH
jgi:hypothetical protein